VSAKASGLLPIGAGAPNSKPSGAGLHRQPQAGSRPLLCSLVGVALCYATPSLWSRRSSLGPSRLVERRQLQKLPAWGLLGLGR